MKFVEAKDKYLALAKRINLHEDPDVRNDPHVKQLLELCDTLVCELAPKPKKKEEPKKEEVKEETKEVPAFKAKEKEEPKKEEPKKKIFSKKTKK